VLRVVPPAHRMPVIRMRVPRQSPTPMYMTVALADEHSEGRDESEFADVGPDP